MRYWNYQNLIFSFQVSREGITIFWKILDEVSLLSFSILFLGSLCFFELKLQAVFQSMGSNAVSAPQRTFLFFLLYYDCSMKYFCGRCKTDKLSWESARAKGPNYRLNLASESQTIDSRAKDCFSS